jgi:Tol biopolymer transport system component/DNA-binding winged helix-turn-helix (wHTH) protein
MNHPDSFPPPFRLHEWRVRPDLNRISGPDGATQIEPRVMAVLLALAARPGELVTRLELLDQVWGDAVVGEEILTRAVSELRRVFGDNARQPAYIETIRHNGYRLIAPVTPDTAATDPTVEPAPSAVADPAPVAAAADTRTGVRLPWLVLIAALVVLAIFGQRMLPRDEPRDVARGDAPAPLTTFPGREYHPALSPDGSRVAFAWSGPEAEHTSIYIKQRNSEAPLRLSDEPGWAAWPAWSPDGQTVAFVQTVDTTSALCLVPSLGGAVRRVVTVAELIEGVDWSVDGEQLAFAARDSDSGQYRLYLLNLATLLVTSAAFDRPDNAGDIQPRFSPDGRQLAWIGHDRAGGSGLFVAPRGGGTPRAVTFGREQLQGLAWTADSRTLVYAAAPAGAFDLWQIPATGGKARSITTPGAFAWNPTIARGSGDLVYEQVQVDQDLWRVAVPDRTAWPILGEPFITSTRWEFEADYQPHGGGLAFVSARSGQPEIWLGDADGQGLRQLTNLGASAITNLRWSPGGDRLACNAVIAGQQRILVADPAGGTPRQVTTGYPREIFGSWAANGQALLVGADAGSGWQLYRLPLDGGASDQLTRGGGLVAQEASDGRTVYFTRPERPGLWRRQSGGRVAPELVLPDLQLRDRFNWRLRDHEIIWVMRTGGAVLLLEHDLDAGESVLLAELPGFQGSGLAVAPRSDTFLYPRLGEAAGDLMIIAGWGAAR